MPLKLNDFISAEALSKDQIEYLLGFSNNFLSHSKKEKISDQMKGKIMATLFYEPSTRTRLSFETAMKRLGGEVIGITDIASSSIAKGESFSDTVKVISKFADFMVIRHNREGFAELASKISSVPVINAGDGTSQHPTQALLDLFTIKKERGKIDGLKIAMSGDLKHGRTTTSLAYLLSKYDVRLKFISPKKLSMKEDVKAYLKNKNINFEETDDFENGIKEVDVLYATRIQGERFSDKKEYEKLKDVYVLTRKIVEKNNPNMTIMHPLPRVYEIDEDVDDLPGAAYFRQVENGVAVRMAIIQTLNLT